MAGASAGFGKTTRGVAIIFVCFDHTETKGEAKKEKEKGNFENEKRSFRAVEKEIRPKQENRRFESLLR